MLLLKISCLGMDNQLTLRDRLGKEQFSIFQSLIDSLDK